MQVLIAKIAESTTTRKADGLDFRPEAGKTQALQCFKRYGCYRVPSPAMAGFENHQSCNPAYGPPEKTGPCGDSGKSRPFGWFFTPVLGPLLSNRWLIAFFLGVGLIQLVLVTTGIHGWQCPIRSTVGITCPGCGLTTATALLVKGRWAAALEMHAFAPFFLMVLGLVAAAIMLPRHYLLKLSTAVSELECKTGITATTILSMILYWLLRNFIL